MGSLQTAKFTDASQGPASQADFPKNSCQIPNANSVLQMSEFQPSQGKIQILKDFLISGSLCLGQTPVTLAPNTIFFPVDYTAT